MGTLLSIEVATEADGACVKLTGELDLSTTAEVRYVLQQKGMAREVTLDLSGVTFLDSTGIHLLVEEKDAAAAAGRSLVISRPSPQVQRIFRLLELYDELTVVGHSGPTTLGTEDSAASA